MLKRAQLNQELNIYILKPEDKIGLKIQAYKNDGSRELQDSQMFEPPSEPQAKVEYKTILI